ncbi:DUF2303 family protein [Hyphomonas sp. UBA4494]|jgi:uncharacterized protein YfdQ (DUF2303 family)|uniref:DUF2303 family protein n=1 Tax=Hyphomonas sp. UBA4494 TaxID=1946631 RepID=UPI0025BF866C|nr:DUF2303 family protein [Hyphomonas sp. UBA4494]
MLDIEQIIEALRGNIHLHARDGRDLVVAPEGYKVHEIPVGRDEYPMPTIIEASRHFDDGDSLTAYANRFTDPDKLLLADLNDLRVTIYIDYHGDDTPRRADHRARWEMRWSEEFAVWKKHDGTLQGQDEFVRFLEEYAGDIIKPDAADILELCKDFEAQKSVEFTSSVRLDNGDRKLNYVSETGHKSGIDVPTAFVIRVPIFYGEEPQDLTCKFRWRIHEGTLRLGYELHRVQPVIDAAFRLAVVRVAEAAGVQALYGR